MKNFTQLFFKKTKWAFLLISIFMFVNASSQSDLATEMFGEVIFLEDFGNGGKTNFEDMGGLGKIGQAYKYEASGTPDDGFYAIVSKWGDFTGSTSTSHSYLKSGWRDHSGLPAEYRDISPFNPLVETITDAEGNTTTQNRNLTHSPDDGRMLFINCAQTGSGVAFKRQVNELCRGAQFEFIAWVASVHKDNNNSKFRFEIWDKDPDTYTFNKTKGSEYDANNTAAGNASPGQIIPNGAKLLARTDQLSPKLNEWNKIRILFELKGQDHCYVVLRNFGSGSGNDIVVDDIQFRPYAPFNLAITLGTGVNNTACQDGLVTLFSEFKVDGDLPEYINIASFGFYFEGLYKDKWYRIGNDVPLQTQSEEQPLEITLPLAVYNYYEAFRLSVANTPSGFGGKCITFNYPELNRDEIQGVPKFTIEGEDICSEDDTDGNAVGKFIIRKLQEKDENGNPIVNDSAWQVKVRLKDGTIKTLTAAELQAANP